MAAPIALRVTTGTGVTAIELPVPLDASPGGDFARTLISTRTLHFVFLTDLKGSHGDK
jgi:hypothetical protein